MTATMLAAQNGHAGCVRELAGFAHDLNAQNMKDKVAVFSTLFSTRLALFTRVPCTPAKNRLDVCGPEPKRPLCA